MRAALPRLGTPPSLTHFPERSGGGYTLADLLYFENTLVHALAVVGEDYAAKQRTARLLAAGIELGRLYDAAKSLEQYTDEWKQGGLLGRAAFTRSFRKPADVTAFRIPEEWTEPSFHHEVINQLYTIPSSGQEGYEAVRSLRLGELPRPTLIEDLRTVLRDMIVRRDQWVAPGEEAPYQTLEHALILLAHYGAEESLPDILNLLRMDAEFIECLFGWELEDTIKVPLYQLGRNYLNDLYAYLIEGGNDGYARAAVASVFTQTALDDPDRRTEVIAYYHKLFTYLLDHRDDRGLMDTDFITLSVSRCTDLRASELFPPIRELYEAGWVAPDMQGDLYEIEHQLRLPPDPRDIHGQPTDLRDHYLGDYRKIASPRPENTDWEQTLRRSMSPVARLLRDYQQAEEQRAHSLTRGTPARASRLRPPGQPKVGRNDPCPCGSGRKYKRCCLRK